MMNHPNGAPSMEKGSGSVGSTRGADDPMTRTILVAGRIYSRFCAAERFTTMQSKSVWPATTNALSGALNRPAPPEKARQAVERGLPRQCRLLANPEDQSAKQPSRRCPWSIRSGLRWKKIAHRTALLRLYDAPHRPSQSV